MDHAIGFPGEFPFTRGIQPTMYRGRLWTMRQYAGFGTAAESNAAVPLPARRRAQRPDRRLRPADPDRLRLGPPAGGRRGRQGRRRHRLARGHGRRCSTASRSSEVSTSMTINATAIILLALYVAVARRQGVAGTSLSGHDPERHPQGVRRARHLHLPAARRRCGSSPTSSPSASASCRNWNTISISGYHIREAGSTAVQEVAFTFANAIAYVEAAVDAGLDVDRFGPRLSFFFNAHNDLLEEVAKFRAARRLWARIMRDRFGATNPRAQQLRFHTQTAGSTLTAQQPDNNIVRVALQALAAVLGGTQSLHTNGRDEALALPTEESARIALRTQQIIAARERRRQHRRPARRRLRRRGADRRDRGRRPRAARARSTAAGGTLAAIETGVHPARDPGRRLPARSWRSTAARRSSSASTATRPTSRRRSTSWRIDPEVERRQVERVRAVRAVARPRGVAGRAGRGRGRGEGDRQPGAADRRRRRGAAPPSARSPTRCARCSASTGRSMPTVSALRAPRSAAALRGPLSGDGRQPLLSVEHLTTGSTSAAGSCPR